MPKGNYKSMSLLPQTAKVRVLAAFKELIQTDPDLLKRDEESTLTRDTTQADG